MDFIETQRADLFSSMVMGLFIPLTTNLSVHDYLNPCFTCVLYTLKLTCTNYKLFKELLASSGSSLSRKKKKPILLTLCITSVMAETESRYLNALTLCKSATPTGSNTTGLAGDEWGWVMDSGAERKEKKNTCGTHTNTQNRCRAAHMSTHIKYTHRKKNK